MSVDIEVLTRTHKRGIHTIDGFEVHSEPSLLSLLRDAIFGGGVSDGAGSRGKPKLPFQAAAHDLYQKLEQEILLVWVDAFQRVPGLGHPEAFLAQWAAHVEPETLVVVDGRKVYAKDAVKGWEDAIRSYFDPPRQAEINAPCVACGERYVYRQRDGETIRSAALSFTRDRDTGESLDARCAVCGAVWAPAQFKFLLEQIAKNEALVEAEA